MMDNILIIALLLLTASFFVWLAVRVKRHPEKDDSMKKVIAEQRGTEYEKGMQKCLVFFYLTFGVFLVLFKWLEDLFDLDTILTIATALFIVGFIVKWRFTGEFSKWGFVILSVLLSLGIGYHIWVFQSSKVKVLPDKLSIVGSYNQKIPYQDIDSVFVVNELPETKHRYHGNNLFPYKRGVYRLKNGLYATFYVLGKEGPYLMMYTMYTYPGLIIVNRKTAEETQLLIEELKDKIEIL